MWVSELNGKCAIIIWSQENGFPNNNSSLIETREQLDLPLVSAPAIGILLFSFSHEKDLPIRIMKENDRNEMWSGLFAVRLSGVICEHNNYKRLENALIV